jgi:hypothetical protein
MSVTAISCRSSIASMEARRSTLGVAVLNDYIYAVGGFDGSAGLNTAEVGLFSGHTALCRL